jgi:primosomal protein N' (replication factor Y) (superfamily II helicase)
LRVSRLANLSASPAPPLAKPARFAEVAVLAQLGRAGGTFTYGVPEAIAPQVSPGILVRVPFTNRQLQGVVCDVEDESNLPRVKDIAEILDLVPVLTPIQLRLARWIADYYMTSMADIVAAMMPPGIGRKTVAFLEVARDVDGARLTPEQRTVVDTVASVGRISVDDLQKRLGDLDIERTLPSLTRRGLLSRTSELAPPRVALRRVRAVRITELGSERLASDAASVSASSRSILELVREHEMTVPDLNRLRPGASRMVASLEKRGLVETEEHIVSRSPLASRTIPLTEPLTLSPAQKVAFDAIADALRARRSAIFLLHGVTGSGKTEVYLQAIAQALRLGRQAMIMVPEISLTPQAVERVAGRFPGRVAVLHSKLSAGERLDEWQRIRHGEVDVVVGPRSALFAPLRDPGLIVIDEEHDPSYKQDGSPRYSGRDAAAVLGRMWGHISRRQRVASSFWRCLTGQSGRASTQSHEVCPRSK